MIRAILGLLLLSVTQLRAETYLCIEDKKAGFALRESEWVVVDLPLSKWLVTVQEDNEDGTKVLRFGEHVPRFEGVSCIGAVDVLCVNAFEQFNFSTVALRFVTSASSGYTREEDNDGRPSIAIGTCAKM